VHLGAKAHYANVLLELAGRDGDVKLPLMSAVHPSLDLDLPQALRGAI
jgi:hypothetical protein